MAKFKPEQHGVIIEQDEYTKAEKHLLETYEELKKFESEFQGSCMSARLNAYEGVLSVEIKQDFWDAVGVELTDEQKQTAQQLLFSNVSTMVEEWEEFAREATLKVRPNLTLLGKIGKGNKNG